MWPANQTKLKPNLYLACLYDQNKSGFLEGRLLSRLGTHLFVKVPRPGDSKVTSLQFSSQAATCYYQSNHLKVEAIPLIALPKDVTNLPAYLHTNPFKC